MDPAHVLLIQLDSIMADYSKYKIEDFLVDEQFIKWVLNPDPDNNMFWKRWVETHPHKKKIVDEAIFTIKHIAFRNQPRNDQQYERVLNKVLQNRHSLKRKSSNSFSSNFWKIAASVSFLVISLILLWSLAQNTSPDQLISVESESITKENPAGQKSSFQLSDGTQVRLNAASSLTFSEPFNDSVRTVELQGEAYFEVAHHPEKPFKVKTNTLLITVLGTSFNVKSYNEDQVEEVALASGKLLVQNDHTQSSLLNPGQKADYHKETSEFKIAAFDYEHYLGWKDNLLVFKSTDFVDFTEKLKRWYGINIEVRGKPHKQWRINGKFENLSLELLMESVKFSKNINYEIHGKELIIEL